jgi:solute:Na+ symporter, SSS family
VIHTDIYQFVLLLVGFIVTLVYCLPELVGSWEVSRASLPDTFLMPDGGRGWMFLLGLFLTFLLGETFAPGYATRFCVGRDIRHTRMGIAGIGIFLTLVFPAVVFLISLYARIEFPDADSQQALPLVIRNLPSVVVAGLFIGALLMAVMSSADSALNSATAIFVKDLFEQQLGWHNVPDGRILLLSRVCSAALGLVAVGVAAANPDIIGLLLFSYMLWAPAIVLPICIGVFSKNRSQSMNRRILTVMLVSTAATLSYHFGLPDVAESLHPTLVGVGVSAGIWMLLSGWSSIRSPLPD